MTSTKIKAAERRRAVLQELQSGTPISAIAAKFKVSERSIYNWQRAARAQGDAGLVMAEVDRRWKFGLQSPDRAEHFVRAAVLAQPQITPDELAGQLQAFGYHAPARTLREVFRRVGVGKAEQRRAAANGLLGVRLSDDDLRRVINEVEAEEGDYSWPSELSLLQDYVKLPAYLGIGGGVVQIVVAEDYPKFGLIAVAGVDKEKTGAQALAQAAAFYESRGVKVVRVTTPRGQVYDRRYGSNVYAMQVSTLHISHDFLPSTGRAKDSRVVSARDLLWRRWLGPRKSSFEGESAGITWLNESLQRWVHENRPT